MNIQEAELEEILRKIKEGDEEARKELIRRSGQGDQDARNALSDLTAVRDTYAAVEGTEM